MSGEKKIITPFFPSLIEYIRIFTFSDTDRLKSLFKSKCKNHYIQSDIVDFEDEGHYYTGIIKDVEEPFKYVTIKKDPQHPLKRGLQTFKLVKWGLISL